MTPPDNSAEARAERAREAVLASEPVRIPRLYEGQAVRLMVAFAEAEATFFAEQNTGGMLGRGCPASPDHEDIAETIANAADDWKTKGYTSALAEVRDMANVGRALMEALPEGYAYNDCPSEIVADLINERDDALALAPPTTAVEDMRGWQDIASAPKDGTEFVGYGKPSLRSPEGAYVTHWKAYGDGSPAHAAWKRGEGPEGGFWHYEPVSNWTNTWLPTRWAALPVPPIGGGSRG